MKRLIKILLVVVAVPIMVALFALWGLYAYGLGALPSDVSPAMEPVPRVALQALWVSETKTCSMLMEPISPWNFVWRFSGRWKAFPPSTAIARHAARLLLARNEKLSYRAISWQIVWTAASIWVSRNWTAEGALSTIFNGSYFGHGFRGIRQAAQGYFGLPAPDHACDKSR